MGLRPRTRAATATLCIAKTLVRMMLVVDRMCSRSGVRIQNSCHLPSTTGIYATEYTQPLASPVQRNCGQGMNSII
jgi:hypothetical protein